MKLPEKMKYRSKPIDIHKNKWVYRDYKKITIVEDQTPLGGSNVTVQITLSLRELKKILEA